jgi:universal stress protein A
MKTMSARNPATITLVPARLNLKKILVPIDFSEPSKKALKYAIPFAEQFGATITLIHVVEQSEYPAFIPLKMEHDRLLLTAKEEAEQRLGQLHQQLFSRARLSKKVIVQRGKPYEEIAKAARKMRADLIIIATHGFTGLKHVLLGSTAERVVRYSKCPVLTIREREKDFV